MIEQIEEVYTSLPFGTGASEEEVSSVREILEGRPGAWITTGELAMLSGIASNRGRSSARIRTTQAVTVLVEREGLPIVSGRSGFCLTDQPSMLARYEEKLLVRNEGVLRRIACVRAIRGRMTQGQQQINRERFYD
jgi:hypothetical protein